MTQKQRKKLHALYLRINKIAGYTEDPPVVSVYEDWIKFEEWRLETCFRLAISRLVHHAPLIHEIKVLHEEREKLQQAIAYINV